MNSEHEIQYYVVQKEPAGLIIDTKVLILLLLGSCDAKLIKECKLTRSLYSEDDFLLLNKIINYFKKIVITPHIIAEVSNLSRQSFYGERLYFYFQNVLEFLKSARTEEQELKISHLLDMDFKVVADFGFTDMAMFQLSKETQMPILTDEVSLHAFLIGHNIPTINFQNVIHASALQN